MASNDGVDWKNILWQILKPALIAAIVATLVTLGRSPGGGQLDIQGISHFSSVYSNDDVEAVDDLIAGDDVTVTDAITSVSLTSTGTIQAEQLTSTDDATITDDLTVTDALSANVATVFGLDATNNITSATEVRA